MRISDWSSDVCSSDLPFLKDSELWNADVRGEWYMGRDERLTAAAFYKKIDNPIETYTTINDSYAVTSSFANAPEDTLYGAEIEAQKYFPLADWSDSPFFTSRKIGRAACRERVWRYV